MAAVLPPPLELAPCSADDAARAFSSSAPLDGSSSSAALLPEPVDADVDVVVGDGNVSGSASPVELTLPPAAVAATAATTATSSSVMRPRRTRALQVASALPASRDPNPAPPAAAAAAVAHAHSHSDWAHQMLLPTLVEFLSTPSRAFPVAFGLLSLGYLLLFSLRTHLILLLLATGLGLLACSLLLSVSASGGVMSLLSPAARHMLLDYNLLELVKISWHSRTLQDVMALVMFPLSKDERRRIIQRLPARLAALITRRGIVHLLPRPAKRLMGHAAHRSAAAAAAAASVEMGEVPQSLLSSVSQPNLFARDLDVEGADSDAMQVTISSVRAPARSPAGSPALRPLPSPAPSPTLVSVRARRSLSTGSLAMAAEQAQSEAAQSQLDDELFVQSQLQILSTRQRAAEREKRRGARREERAARPSSSMERKDDDSNSDSSDGDSDAEGEHVEWRVRRSLRPRHDHASAFSTSSSSSSASSPSSSSSPSEWSGSSTPDVRNYDECTPSPAHIYFGSPADEAAAEAAGRAHRGHLNPSFTFPLAAAAGPGAGASSSVSASYRAPLSTFLPLPSSVDDLSFANLLDRQLRLQARDSLRNLWRALWAAAADEAKQQWAVLRLRIPPPLLPYCTPQHMRALLPVGGALAAAQILAVSPRCRGLLLSGARLGRDAAVLGTACAAAVTVYTELHASVDARPAATAAPAAAVSSLTVAMAPAGGANRSPAASAVAAPSGSLLPSLALYCRVRAMAPAAAAASPLLARLHSVRLVLAWLLLRYRASGPLRTATLVLALWMAWLARRSAPMRGAQHALVAAVRRVTRWP